MNIKENSIQSYIVITVIKGYQYFISPFLGKNCRYVPSCSDYAVECFRKFSFFRAMWYSLKRIMRCNPYINCSIEDKVPENIKS